MGLTRLLGLERMESYLPQIDDDFLVPDGQRWEPSSPVVAEAALFVGCIMSTAFAETDRATARLLARAGYAVTSTPAQGCCGALNAHSGDREGARELARRNVQAFEAAPEQQLVAVNAAGCGAMLKEYGHLLGDDPDYAERASRFASRVRDATELLAGRLPPLPSSRSIRVTYQDACHLAQAQGITRQPRQLLEGIGGLELVEMLEPGICCGSAGVYNLTRPAIADRLLDRKLANALMTGAETIVTANPGCLLQLRAGLAARGQPVRVCYLLDVLDEAYSVAEAAPVAHPSAASAAPA
jgi:glycolate oxidase iron-sulfur subunit